MGFTLPKGLAKLAGLDAGTAAQIETFASSAPYPDRFVRASISGPLFQPHVQALAEYMQTTGAKIEMQLLKLSTGERGFAFVAIHPDGTRENLQKFNAIIPNP